MSTKRAAMAPPDLPGFTYVDVLGSGGFADVYLYEQHLPRRRVAVKVLLTERMSSGSVAEFTAEANVMAMLSTHPAIVTIYQAGVAGDGRPYLVMEYCPKPNLQVRYRREPFAVAEALRVGVQVAAAVETAHRAGVLHRDIKPANILVTEYNRPALTDFGIASTTTAAAESAGLSIPWSPPESFADVPESGARSDVYALGATVYSLLSGRSPFEVPGERNTAADLIHRIETAPLPRLSRPDMPVSLQHVLERAMAKSAADRYDSAIAFARSLQKVQIELSHSVTAIDILDDGLPDDTVDDEDDGLTRVRGVVSIDPETSPAAGLTRPSATTAPSRGVFAAPADAGFAPGPAASTAAVDDTVMRDAAADGATMLRPAEGWASAPSAPASAAPAPAPHAPAVDDAATARRAPASLSAAPVERPGSGPRTPAAAAGVDARRVPAADASGAPRRRTGLWVALGAAALVIVAVVVGVSLPGILSGAMPAADPPAEEPAAPQDPVMLSVPAPADLTGTVTDAGVVFTWTNPVPENGDRYLWGTLTRADEDAALQPVDVATVTVPADPSGTTCIEVTTLRASGQSSDAVRACAP
ncbi:serine/threonine-protein kinase [Microbacterium hominis]|uniref:non-specific serine/threonine protein kinase n=1 Tax=Microbacterium hominis TaxID=162426 RepID=A0A7D4PKK2_9MICO|nr:serine/threonine-protein kinase [Microbacterium hominis]QKJ18195.1 protein kinase [Microbacterium hominis]